MGTVRGKRERAVELLLEAERQEKGEQERCSHPFKSLMFTSGAVESRNAAWYEREVYVRCQICNKHMSLMIKWHRDD